MNTQKHITPEQQIENQKAEIESLQRKNESLEKELQKHLDPDSGDLNPSIKYHYRSAESALVADLQRKLDDCLGADFNLTRDNDLEESIYAAMHGLFLPKRQWSEHDKVYKYYTTPWWYLREFLFDVDLFDNHWTNADFRKGVSILNDLVLVLDSDIDMSDRTSMLERMDRHEFGYRVFMSRDREAEQFMHRGTYALITALILIRKNQDHPEIKGLVSDGDLLDMLVTLKSVYSLQTMWIGGRRELKSCRTHYQQEARALPRVFFITFRYNPNSDHLYGHH